MLENNFKPSNTGKSIIPSIKVIKKLAIGMNVDFDTLLSMVNGDVSLIDNESDLAEMKKETTDEEIYKSANINFIRIPLYSPVCCGDGGFNDDNILEYIAVPSHGLNPHLKYFGQYADGDSMKDAGITAGNLLVFERVSRVSNGVIGCFCVDDNQAMCKKFKEENGIVTLQPMNSDFESISIDPLNRNFRCIGKLKKSLKTLSGRND